MVPIKNKFEGWKICTAITLCAIFLSPNYLPPAKMSEEEVRVKLIDKATTLLGYAGAYILVKGKRFRNDCSGFIRAIWYDVLLVDVMSKMGKLALPKEGANGVVIFYNLYKASVITNRTHHPKIGDLILFNDTFDKNRNGLWDDPLTHIGIVEGIDEEGTVSYIHHTRGGLVRYAMTLTRPDIYKEGGKIYNDFLRRRPASDTNRSRYLSEKFFDCYIPASAILGRF